MPWALELSTYSTKLLVVKIMLLLMATYILRTLSTSLIRLRKLHMGNGGKYTYIHAAYMYILYTPPMTKSQPGVIQEMPAMHRSGAMQHPSCSRGGPRACFACCCRLQGVECGWKGSCDGTSSCICICSHLLSMYADSAALKNWSLIAVLSLTSGWNPILSTIQ